MRKKLNTAFHIVWFAGLIVGILTFILFLLTVPHNSPGQRWLASLSPSNIYHHPAFYEAERQDFEALLGNELDMDTPAYLVIHQDETIPPEQIEARERLRLLIRDWVYPVVFEYRCAVDSAEAIASQCGPIAEGGVVMGWGFTDIPGLECASNPRRQFVCR
ncbi:MAG: hypothetical protein CL610_21775 [Anaerolineaceae bacterium]|nr:hypothetical protein [Anaerolineaceae bacterium]